MKGPCLTLRVLWTVSLLSQCTTDRDCLLNDEMVLSKWLHDADTSSGSKSPYRLLGNPSVIRHRSRPRTVLLRAVLVVVVVCAFGALAIILRIHLVCTLPLSPIKVDLPVVLSSKDRLSSQHAASLDTQALQISLQIPRQPMKCKIGPLEEAKYRTVLRGSKERFYLAANLYNNEEILPNMIQEIATLARALGPSRLYVSIYANGSTDRT